ncbi:MAG: hypothetical protein GTO18_17595 [Anaerolineales bacterium]|nr:hypothetical protein [Anaerolineales bacterium]
MRVRLRFFIPLIICLTWFGVPGSAWAQDEDTLELRFRRDFGFGLGSNIQGRFTITASGPNDLESVEFIFDGEVVAEDTEEPFQYKFHTDDYSPGSHRISAVGYTSSSGTLHSDTHTYTFLSAEDARGSTAKIILPLLVLVGLFALVGMVLPALLSGRKGAFQLGEYSYAGGAVCRRCGLPFSRHTLAPNLLVGKLERCPHCGKWALVPRASDVDLKAAEARYTADVDEGKMEPEEREEERLRRMLDESRYED